MVAAQRVFDEFLAALGAQVEPKLLVHVVADLRVRRVFGVLQSLLDFLLVVAVVFALVHGCRIERRVDFHLHDIAQVLGIECPLAAIT